MAEANRCAICTNHTLDLKHVESVGHRALLGELSWVDAGEQAGVPRRSLKNHMEKHVVGRAVAEAQDQEADELDALIAEARQGLITQFYSAPDDVRPLILVAIQNLDGLRTLRPSQDALIKALRTIQEMTGMKTEQKLMLGFARAMFNKPQPVESTSRPALVSGD